MLEPASIGSLYREGIVETGREPAFLYLVAFLGTFAFIRTSAHMIRAQVSWWPGNVNVGGTHIHHLVWGIIILLISGYLGVVVAPGSPGQEILAVAFGFGTGLTLDEFALWLELRDVYWEEDGRKSIDAVIITAIIAGFGVLGFGVWLEVADGVADGVRRLVALFGGLSLLACAINATKQKFWVALAGLIVPIVGFVGVFRLARPQSLWARRFYSPAKLERARQRYGATDQGGSAEAAQDGAGSGAGGEDASEEASASAEASGSRAGRSSL